MRLQPSSGQSTHTLLGEYLKSSTKITKVAKCFLDFPEKIEIVEEQELK